MRKKQFQLFNENKLSKIFGGDHLIDKRKSKRPLSTKLPIHLILRSKHKEAYKAFSYRSKRNQKILESVARQFNVRIYQRVFSHTHLHLVILKCMKYRLSFDRGSDG